jgi:hypothetical protein
MTRTVLDTHIRNGQPLIDCDLNNIDLGSAVYRGATLRLCALDDVVATGACFDEATIEDSTATGADFSRASLRGAHLTETSFARAVLREAILDRAEGDGVEFRGADLTGASLVSARFDEADFRGADLRGADLSRGRFHSADFRGALLDGARFDGADFRGAWFDAGSNQAERSESSGAPPAPETLDRALLNGLREAVKTLPTVPNGATRRTGDLLARLARSLQSLDADPRRAAAEWQPWIDRLMQTAKETPDDFAAVLDTLCDAPPLRAMPTDADPSLVTNFVLSLRRAYTLLESAGVDPPDAWSPALEKLFSMMSGERPFDPAVLNEFFAHK